MRTATTAVPLLLATLAIVSGAGATNPWSLQCPAMPTEQRLPAPLRAAALRFFPWVRPAAEGLRAGPDYIDALSNKTAISRDGDDLDSVAYYLHRALIAVAPSYPDAVTVRGHRLGAAGARTTLGFSTDGASRCTVTAPDVTCLPRPLRYAAALPIAARGGWRIVPTEIRIGRTGCFRLTITGVHLRTTVPLAIPGPDYGTTGW